jgi:predicted transcriptional regulator
MLNSFTLFTQALKEAELLKQQTFYQFNQPNYMILHENNQYIVEMFNWILHKKALENNNLMVVI